MNQGAGQNNNRVQSFLEALRSKQVSNGPQEFGQRSFGTPEVFSERKKVEEARRHEFLANRHKEEIEIFSATIASKERRLTEIHERLIILSKRVEKKSPEIRKAVVQNIVKPNRSDESFMDHLQSLIDYISTRTENSGSWLAMYNSRSLKKGGVYWDQAKKGGTKYTQALDRNVATSVG